MHDGTFPQLTDDWDTPVEVPDVASTDSNDDDISLAALESEIEQTADTLEILERIASLQLQQLEHQRTQALRDVRGVFFGFVVSVAVVVAGVAPLVQASHAANADPAVDSGGLRSGGAVYAIVRARQSKDDTNAG